MLASEAKKKLQENRAKESVKRVFPIIEDAIRQGKGALKFSLSWDKTTRTSLSQAEFDILSKEYGYYLEAIYDDSGDYHKSDKKIGYNVIWDK